MILIISNGYGEDAVGNALARELQGEADIVAYPLVGTGHAYQRIPLLDPREVPPSGGFGLRSSPVAFLSDIRAGILRLWQAQRKTLSRGQGKYQRILAIGDVFCLWMASHAGRPVVFAATAKSEFNESHRWLERSLIRRYSSVVYVRDAVTADVLTRYELPARYVGNPLMDTIGSGQSLERDPNLPTVTLLPGSRNDAPGNLALLLQLCTEVRKATAATFFCPLALTLRLDAVVPEARRVGWEVANSRLRSEMAEVKVTQEFGPAVRSADVVVGLAGTANEQAAGLGKPVVAFPGNGAQYTRRFMMLQHRLLGDALIPTPDWKAAAAAVVRLLSNPHERAQRGQVGRERMGEPGAIRRIAADIAATLT